MVISPLLLHIFYIVSRHYNINRLTEQNLGEIVDILTKNMGFGFDHEISGDIIEEVCHRYNARLIFGPDEQSMTIFTSIECIHPILL